MRPDLPCVLSGIVVSVIIWGALGIPGFVILADTHLDRGELIAGVVLIGVAGLLDFWLWAFLIISQARDETPNAQLQV